MNNKLSLIIVLSNLFIAFAGIGIVVPILPTIMNELSISGSTAANMFAVFSLAQLLVSPIAGKWSDQFGRKKMIVIGLLIFGLSEFLFAIGASVEALFISRILGGISGAFIMPAVTAFIADITTTQDRGKALGYMSAAINTSFIVGPGIGGFVAEFGSRAPFYVAGVLAILASVLSVVLLKEPKRSNEPTSELNEKAGMKTVFHQKYFIAFMIIFLFSFGLAAFESLFSLFVDRKFSFTAKDIAIVITGSGLFGVITQLFLFDRLTKKIGEIALVRYSMVLSIIMTFTITIVENYWAILLSTCVLFTGFDLMRPAVTTYLSRTAGSEQGFVGGMNSTFTSIGYIGGPIIGGILFDINYNYPFYFSSVILAVGLFVSFFWRIKVAPSQVNQEL